MEGSRSILLIVPCLMLMAVAGVRAQITASTSPVPLGTNGPSADRRIELLIRSQFSVPPSYEIILGARTKSDTADFDNLPVILTQKDRRIVVNFLISRDGNTLARVQKFNINDNPALAIDVTGRPSRGASDAKVEIISFDDLECPYCGLLNSEILPATLYHYKGLIKVVYKDYPLPGHPWAMRAAVDANCLASLSHQAYWAYVDFVHSHPQDITGKQPDLAKSFHALDNIADTFGTQNKVNEPQLAMCLKRQDESEVNQSLKVGTSLGVDGTPQVFVDGERLPSGARPVEELWPAIDRALKAQGIQPPPAAPQTVSLGADKAQPSH